MKKKILYLIPVLTILIIIISLIIFSKKEKTFYLENKYYGTSGITEIKLNELNDLINKKESFGIFVYQPMCVASSNFEQVLKDFTEEYSTSFYKVAFTDVKDELDFLNYYPSFIIYLGGEMVDFLESDKDEDTDYYLSVNGFKNWFTKYVKVSNNQNTNNSNKESDNYSSSQSENIIEDITLDNIVKEDGKVNIYFFWGDGCPHCAEEKTFFNSIEKEYGDYYNLYVFEVWYNEENAQILKSFANAMNDEVTGVPYTIIGSQSFIGFGSNSKEGFKKAITESTTKDVDVYFDKIKK